MSLTSEKEVTTFRGTFKGGVIVLNDSVTLPEGTDVTIILSEYGMPHEMRKEFAQWASAGADAWKLISKWESEEGIDPETLA